MSERSATKRLEALWRWIYRGTTTVVAAALTVTGIVCIVGATLVPEDEVWHPILRDIGVAALASGLLSTAYEYFLRRAFLEDATNSLRTIFGERDEKLDQLEKAGVKGIHPRLTKLGKSHIAMEFRRARHSIRILQTWSGNFSEDNDIGDTLREVTRGADIDVRILLLNPRSSVAPLRGKDLNEDVEERIKEDIKQLKRLCNDRPRAAERIQVRFYDATPAMSIYGYDDRNVVGFFWRRRTAQRATQLEILSELGGQQQIMRNPDSDDLHLAKAVDEQFEDLWRQADTVNAKETPEWEQA